MKLQRENCDRQRFRERHRLRAASQHPAKPHFSNGWTSGLLHLFKPLMTAALPGLILLLIAGSAGSGPPVGVPWLDVSRNPHSGIMELRASEDGLAYYILERSPDLLIFLPDAVALGLPAPQWERTATKNVQPMFYRLRRVPRDAPLDTDGDGIDDVWELQRPLLLNPLDPSDAGKDPDGDGHSHLEEYRAARRRTPRGGDDEIEAISREVSVFNFGEPSAFIESFSPEVSVYNGETAPQTDISEVISREVSVFNFGEADYTEAISAEVSIYSGETPPLTDISEAISREVSVLNE